MTITVDASDAPHSMHRRLITALSPSDPSHDWQIVLRNPGSSHVVLYHAESGSLQVRPSSSDLTALDAGADPTALLGDVDAEDHCPFCRQPMPAPPRPGGPNESLPSSRRPKRRPSATDFATSAASYFGLLSDSHANTPYPSRPGTPVNGASTLDADLVDGFFERFFKVEAKLGRGQRGNVYLCRHILHGNELGHYALKKIAVGASSSSLLATLKEVKHLEKLRHPNVVAYHHAWLEHDAVSQTAPRVPTLFLLMDFCNGGSLDSFIQGRSGASPLPEDSREARIRSFRERRNGMPRGAIHFLRLDEIVQLFRDVCEGLAYMHAHNVLHLDLKAENVLLQWSEPDALLPTALLSDFGSAEERSSIWRRKRSGATGTLDWVPPEAFEIDPATGALRELASHADLWALGLVLHQLCYFRLPYHQHDVDLLRQEIAAYPGFDEYADHGRHDLPFWLLRLLSRLIARSPTSRPSAAMVLQQLDRIAGSASSTTNDDKAAMVPTTRSPLPSPSLSPMHEVVPRRSRGRRRARANPTMLSYLILVLAKLLVLRSERFVVQYLVFCLCLAEVLSCRPWISVGVSVVQVSLVAIARHDRV